MEYNRFKYSEDEREKQLKDYDVITETNSGRTMVNCNRLADLIQAKYDYYFMTMRDSDDIYYFDGRCFRRKGDTVIKNLVGSYLKDLSTDHRKNETIGSIRDRNYYNTNTFEVDLELINLRNGIYNIDTDKLLEHFPGVHFLNYLPVNYKKNTDCPKFKKFLSEVASKEDIPVIQEFFGYCLYRKYHFHKALLLYGDGRNGKSTLLNVLSTMLGKENVSAIELHSLCNERFQTSSLFGKLANIASEIQDKSLKASSMFKKLTGGDKDLSAEFKFKDLFKFTNYAKLLFSANRIPQSEEDTLAYYSRWILIEFSHIFDDTNKKTNPNLLDKLTTDKELSGIFNWSLIGLKRLLKKKKFSYKRSVEEVKNIYKSKGDSVYIFCKEFIQPSIFVDYIAKQELYKRYEKWCIKNNHIIVPPNTFSKLLKKHVPKVEFAKRGHKDEQIPVYSYIKWK